MKIFIPRGWLSCLLSRCRSHAAAFVGTTPAGGCTLLTMAHLMLAAFIPTSLADVSALLANRFRIFATASHVTCGQATYLGTVHVQGDAARHHLHILLLQAGCRTEVTGVGTSVTSFDTRCKFLLCHDFLQSVKASENIALGSSQVLGPMVCLSGSVLGPSFRLAQSHRWKTFCKAFPAYR